MPTKPLKYLRSRNELENEPNLHLPFLKIWNSVNSLDQMKKKEILSCKEETLMKWI